MTPIVVDLGKTKKKDIGRLKKGKGKLVDEVDAVLEQVRGRLADDGAGKELVPVVILWRPKQRKRRPMLPFGL
jgi:hypothetical protein